MPDRPVGAARPAIHPNPCTGRFIMAFAGPLAEGGSYAVFDAIGRRLFERSLHAGQEYERVDLSRFGRGIYMVRIAGLHGMREERIVVE